MSRIIWYFDAYIECAFFLDPTLKFRIDDKIKNEFSKNYYALKLFSKKRK